MSAPKGFARYAAVGIGNTAVHWLVFFLLHTVSGLSQAVSNGAAFAVAASLSFFANARFTFATKPTQSRYLVFMVGLGSLSLSIGAIADRAGLAPWLTVLAFSGISLSAGYGYARYVVFKRALP